MSDEEYTEFFENYKSEDIDIDEYYNGCSYSDLGNS